MTVFTTIGIVLAGVGSYWRDIGGAAFVFHTFKNVVFGKNVKTVEYPAGLMKTITVRVPTVRAMRKKIAHANQLEDPSIVKQLYKWEDNFWTEPIKSSSDVRNLQEYSWVVWSRSVSRVPGRGVRLKEMGDPTTTISTSPQDRTSSSGEGNASPSEGTLKSGTDTDTDSSFSGDKSKRHGLDSTSSTSVTSPKTAQATSSATASDAAAKEMLNTIKISCIRLLVRCKQSGDFSEEEASLLFDLALNDDSYILALYSNFKNDRPTFVRYCKRKASTLIMKEGSPPVILPQERNEDVNPNDKEDIQKLDKEKNDNEENDKEKNDNEQYNKEKSDNEKIDNEKIDNEKNDNEKNDNEKNDNEKNNSEKQQQQEGTKEVEPNITHDKRVEIKKNQNDEAACSEELSRDKNLNNCNDKELKKNNDDEKSNKQQP